jgi:hypothetical protein
MKDWKTYFGNKSVGPGGGADYEINNEESGWIIPEKLRKNWKLFLESNSRDQEILDNIRDILISLKVDHHIRVLIRNESIPFEFGKVRVNFIVGQNLIR